MQDENEDIIKLEFNEAKENTFKMYVKENSTVQKDRRIGEYLNQTGKKVPVISNFYGRILKIDIDEKQVIIEKCKHEMVLKTLCTSCGCTMPKAQTYISIHSDITFSQKKAALEEQSIVKKYLESKKLILLLDIDNTILHASNFELNNEECENLKKVYNWALTKISLNLPGQNNSHPIKQKLFLKFRPFFKDFLEATKDLYDIYIYTQGTVEYAENIIDYVNSTFGYNYFSKERLVARTGLTWENKSIKRIFPTTEDMVVILDDRLDVWTENAQNLINVVPYYFFHDEKYFRVKSKFRPEDDDYALFSVIRMLLFIREAFYHNVNSTDKHLKKTTLNNSQSPNVKVILNLKLKGILHGLKFTFSSLYAKEVDIYATRNAYLIEVMGGSLYEEYDEEIDVVLTREYKKTEKIRQATNEGKLIIHEAWLEYCAFFLVKLKEGDFILSAEKPILQREVFNLTRLFNENKENIENYYKYDENSLVNFWEKIN